MDLHDKPVLGSVTLSHLSWRLRAWRSCWYCEAPLRADCWEDTGHCGHPEADALDEAAEAGQLTNSSLSEAIALA